MSVSSAAIFPHLTGISCAPACDCSGEMDPIDLQIRNLGQTGSMKQRYQGITGCVTLPSIPAFTLAKKGIQGNADRVQRSASQAASDISPSVLKNVAMTGLQSQVEAVESMYRKMVRQLETLAQTASGSVPA